MSPAAPEGFESFTRPSPLLDPWRPIYARVLADRIVLALELRTAHTNSRATAHGDVRTATEEVTHAVLWEQFANALGTTSLEGAKLESTKSLVGACNALYSQPVTSLGGLYAFEAQQPKTSTSKLKGLQEHYWELSPEVQPYFAVHADDVQEMAWIVDRLEGKSDDEKRQAVEACERVAKGLWDALTGIHEKHCTMN